MSDFNENDFLNYRTYVPYHMVMIKEKCKQVEFWIENIEVKKYRLIQIFDIIYFYGTVVNVQFNIS